MTDRTPNNSSTYIPLDAAESAVLSDVQTLLPLTVYEELDRLIAQAVDKVDQSSQAPSGKPVRSHHAISIDGPRGSGKTSVLLNLKSYIALVDQSGQRQKEKRLLPHIHVLEPIDPTLLEDGESLFLHIIVAAVLRDEDIKEAQRNKPEKARELNRCLEQLAHGLEGVEQQQTRHGLDKIRAMFGNQHLAECVLAFFEAALCLLDKKLLVLPIDDVDTSLNRAFENLEIIRRYLTWSCVLPIVSGDRGLYDEVTWRDFHGRLTKDSNYLRGQAYEIAIDLAHEYQRKILPLPRRLEMPKVSEYWTKGNVQIKRHATDEAALSLRNFHAWLTSFVSGPVNGLEDSRLDIPIPSIRALAQLINKSGDLIPALPETIRKAESPLEVARAWQMPTLPLHVLRAFEDRHQTLRKDKKRDYAAAYDVFASELAKAEPVNHRMSDDMAGKWVIRMKEYFSHEPQGAKIFLALEASLAWSERRQDQQEQFRSGVFSTPLFQPLKHQDAKFKNFDQVGMDGLSDWAAQLKDRLPEGWVTEIGQQKTFLPYPVPEVGINTARKWRPEQIIRQHQTGRSGEAEKVVKDRAVFLMSLLTQHNFYTNAYQAEMLNIGRVFELLISSLVGPVTLADLQRIQREAPFFSTRDLAPTKQITPKPGTTKENGDDSQDAQEDESQNEPDEQLLQLHAEIVAWRELHQLDQVSFAPWLIYKVFNKVYSQVASNENSPSRSIDLGSALKIPGMVFYATWSAFGSFEKGALFGLSEEVATVNLRTPENFESSMLFKKNVLPLVWGHDYGMWTRTATYYLATHPLRYWMDDVLSVSWSQASSRENPSELKPAPDKAEPWLCSQLGIEQQSILRTSRIAAALRIGEFTLDQAGKLFVEFVQRFPRATAVADRMEKAIQLVFSETV